MGTKSQRYKNTNMILKFEKLKCGDYFLYGDLEEKTRQSASVISNYYSKKLNRIFAQFPTKEGIIIKRIDNKKAL